MAIDVTTLFDRHATNRWERVCIGDLVERVTWSTPDKELWKALGATGFVGVNLPEEYGGGGAGSTELAIVGEETAAAGTPLLLLLVSSAICVPIGAHQGGLAPARRRSRRDRAGPVDDPEGRLVARPGPAGGGLASEYGLAHLWGMARLLKLAPVSREMILNYVAGHTLRLPRSY